jgi:hypothetical protein
MIETTIESLLTALADCVEATSKTNKINTVARKVSMMERSVSGEVSDWTGIGVLRRISQNPNSIWSRKLFLDNRAGGSTMEFHV